MSSTQPLLCCKPSMTPRFMPVKPVSLKGSTPPTLTLPLRPWVLLLSPLPTLLQPQLSPRNSLSIPSWPCHWLFPLPGMSFAQRSPGLAHSPLSSFGRKATFLVRASTLMPSFKFVKLSPTRHPHPHPTFLSFLRCSILKTHFLYLLPLQIIYLIVLFPSASKAGVQIF